MAALSAGHRELIQLLEAIQTATEAVTGQEDSPAVAKWLTYRADTYDRIATEHPSDSELPAEMAQAAAQLDRGRAARIQRTQRTATR